MIPRCPVAASARWHRCFDWSHPVLELALLKLHLSNACERLEHLLLTCSFEIRTNGPLKRCLVLLDQLGHAIELLDAPFMTARNPAGEMTLLFVEQILKQIFHRISFHDLCWSIVR